MLDLAWSEILLIAVVALVVIGPKDLPGAIRGIADFIKTGKQKLASFQQQADELVKEAKLDEVRNQIADVKGALNEIRNFDLKGEITKAVDGDGTLTKTFSENPMGSSMPAWTPPPTARDTPDAPAMIPPQTMAPYKAPEPLPTPPAPDMPSFLPPSTPALLNVAPVPVVTPAEAVASAPTTPPAAAPEPPAAAVTESPAAAAAAKIA
ncbi:MAG: Sec-independent protein translocase protein TatB [Roseococcus sp.]